MSLVVEVAKIAELPNVKQESIVTRTEHAPNAEIGFAILMRDTAEELVVSMNLVVEVASIAESPNVK